MVSSEEGRCAARRRAKQRVGQLQDPSGVAIVVWAQSRKILTNGDLFNLMRVSRSVSTALAKVEARAFSEFEATIKGSELEEAMWKWFLEEAIWKCNMTTFHVNELMCVDRVRKICWGDFLQKMKKAKVTLKKSTPQSQEVKVTLKKTSGEIWVETKPLPVRCTLSYIVFDVARVDRFDSVVPYLIYNAKVQPYWKSLRQFTTVQNGSQALEMTVVLQPIETPIALLFDKAGPLNEDSTDMPYEKFKNCLTDPNDERYMDMERLMHTVYPAADISEIWPWDAVSLSSRSPTLNGRQGFVLTTCSNLRPIGAYPVNHCWTIS